MVQFNELRISNNTNKLIIDVSISEAEYFKNNYITKIIVCDQDHYKDGKDVLPETIAWEKDYTSKKLKHVRVELSEVVSDEGNYRINADLHNSLLFVYVLTDTNTYAPDTPQELQVLYDMRTVTDLYKIYELAMRYVRELEKECTVPIGFTDYILRMHALNLCIRTGNYVQAIKYWNKFFKDKTPCSCCLK